MEQMTSAVERLYGWILDRDGDLYGDEQERLRWYEAGSATTTLQTIAVTWVVAIAALVGGRPAAPALTAVLIALYVPMLLTVAYIQRRRVRTLPRRWGRRRVVLTLLTVLPYTVAAVALLRAFRLSSDANLGAAVGAALGILLAVVVLVARYRKERSRETDTADIE
ncbi:hypothetical protein [Cryptosporangium japonicum]|uniref:DUF2029 domain-containing protein n=1 Tax=Cryptosporangium japonicum TaxID=80872 RepID=A0ABP3ERD6_9ACTN